METIVPYPNEDPLQLLRRCLGYYNCPIGSDGKPIGPLVGYAGKYAGSDGKKLPYVGLEYANFAAIERHGPCLDNVAERLLNIILSHFGIDLPQFKILITGFIGVPEGGKALATRLSSLSGTQYLFPDKEVTAVKTETSREESHLFWGRHATTAGENWILVEDTCNNFDNTQSLISLVEKTGARVLALTCFLNRTVKPQFNTFFKTSDGRDLPIIPRVRKEIPEYRQDDVLVADLVATNNVVWKPKPEWSRLAKAMADHEAAPVT